MTFYTFMMRNYKCTNIPAGDLAEDMKLDSEKFPRNRQGWHAILHDYLVENDACSDCLEVFEECWEEYVRCEKKKLNRNS